MKNKTDLLTMVTFQLNPSLDNNISDNVWNQYFFNIKSPIDRACKKFISSLYIEVVTIVLRNKL